MSAAPDPSESHDAAPPRDPSDYSLRRNGFGLGFWLAMGFTAFCVLAAVVVSRYGPVLFPVKPTTAAPMANAPGQAHPAPPLGNPAARR